MRYCESLAVRRSLGVLTVCAALEDVAHGHDPDKPVGRVEDTTLLAAAGAGRRPTERAAARGGPRDGPGRDVRGQSRALPGHRPAARRASGTPFGGCRAPAWSSWAAGRTTSAATGGMADRLGIQSRVHFLGPRPVSAAARPAPAGRRAGVAAPQGPQHADEDLLLSRLRHRRAGHPAPHPHPGPRRPDGVPGRARARAARAPAWRRSCGTGRCASAWPRTPRPTCRRSSRPRPPARKLASFYDAMEAKVAGARREAVLSVLPTLRSMVVYALVGRRVRGSQPDPGAGAPHRAVRACSPWSSRWATWAIARAVGHRRPGQPPSPGARAEAAHRVDRRSALVGLGIGIIGVLSYGMPLGWPRCCSSAPPPAALMMVAGRDFQSEQRFAQSLTLVQSPNIVLLVAALAAIVGHVRSAWLPVLISTIGFVAAAAIGWTVLLRRAPPAPATRRGPVLVGRGPGLRRRQRLGPAAHSARAADPAARAPARGPGPLRRARRDRGLDLPGDADGRRLQSAAPAPRRRHGGGAPAAGRARSEAGRHDGAGGIRGDLGRHPAGRALAAGRASTTCRARCSWRRS